MAVIGQATVRELVASGRRVVAVERGDLVTPQAQELIEQLGLEVIPGPIPMALPPAVDSALAARRILMRRSPRWISPQARSTVAPQTLTRIAMVGAGAVGSTTGHLLAAGGACHELVLIDLVPGLAESVALDLNHASGITNSLCRASGGNDLAALTGAQVVVISAGRPRTPGMSRSALLEVNGRVVRQAAEAAAQHAPDSILIVVTNPLDEMTIEALGASGFPRSRVLGMAGTLDSSRFRHSLASAAGVAPADVDAITLGSHGDEMVPVLSRATIKGRPADRVLSRAELKACVEETIGGGAAVVALRRTGSAYYAPAHAIVEVIDHIRGARAGWVPVSVMLDGEYGISGTVVGVPARLGPAGVEEVIELPLSPDEIEGLNRAAAAVAARMSASE